MSTTIGMDNYVVISRKDGVARTEFHGTKDTRWHSVERAASLYKAGFVIQDIREDGKTDVLAHQALLDRHGIMSQYATEHKLVAKPSNGKAPAEKRLELTFDQQETMAEPVRNLTKLSTAIG